MTPIRIIFFTFFVCVGISSVMSDGNEGAMENAGEAVDDAAEDVKDWGKGAVKDTGDWIKGAGETVDDAAQDIADRVKRDNAAAAQKEEEPEDAIEKHEDNEDGDAVRKYIWGKFRV